MRIILPRVSLHNSSIIKKGGSILPMRTRTTTSGRGATREFYENTDVKHPNQSFSEKANKRNMIDSVKIKSSKPKKYISFNV
jgi:hypothetical protein